jgi:hypothetical protein
MNRTLIALGACAVLVLTARPAAAQEGPAPVHMSVGLLGAAGIPGPVAALRFSAIGARAGFDIDWGVLADDGPADNRFVAAQLRILTRRRTEGGHRVAVLVGGNQRDTVQRTEIRYPGGITIVRETPMSGIAGQFGVGFDWLGSRSRIGLDLVTGGSGSAGPRIFAKLFVVWGRTLQVE